MKLADAKKIKTGTMLRIKKTNNIVTVQKCEFQIKGIGPTQDQIMFYMTDGSKYPHNEVLPI